MGKAIRFMSYKKRVIWYQDGAFMVARGDRTDEYFSSWQAARDWIDSERERKKKGLNHNPLRRV